MTKVTIQREHDWLSSLITSSLAWWVPEAAIIAGLLIRVPARTTIWVVALAWMGTACIVNARRCGRTHCRFTGPFYLVMILPVLVLGFTSYGFFPWLAGPAKVYKAGEIFFEPPGSEHLVSENASATEPASILAIHVADDGAQLTVFDE